MHTWTSTSCQSLLLAAARPFHWALAVFVVSPPPCLTYDAATTGTKCKVAVRFLYAAYLLTLLLLTMWNSYNIDIVAETYIEILKLGSLTQVLSKVQSVSVFFVMIVSQLATLLRFKHLLRGFAAIEQLEHDICWRSLMHRLGAVSRFKRTDFQRQLICKSGCLLLFTCIVHTYINFKLVGTSMSLPHRLLIAFTRTLIQAKSVEFCLMVQEVHLLLQQLLEELHFVRKQFIATRRQADRRCLYAALQYNQQCLLRVWSLVNKLETYFAVPMLVLFLYDGLAITTTVNWAYISQKYNPENSYTFALLSLIASVLIHMMLPCWLAQSCIQLYESFGSVLHSLQSDGSDVKLSMCLREYSLQLMHQKLLFTCDGLLDINLNFFGSIVMTIAAYVVILIQFRLQTEADEVQEERRKKQLKLSSNK